VIQMGFAQGDRMTDRSNRGLVAGLVAALAMAGSLALQAQEARTAALVKELTALLTQRKLDSIAARHPAAPD
jgi:hypothetical protein